MLDNANVQRNANTSVKCITLLFFCDVIIVIFFDEAIYYFVCVRKYEMYLLTSPYAYSRRCLCYPCRRSAPTHPGCWRTRSLEMGAVNTHHLCRQTEGLRLSQCLQIVDTQLMRPCEITFFLIYEDVSCRYIHTPAHIYTRTHVHMQLCYGSVVISILQPSKHVPLDNYKVVVN